MTRSLSIGVHGLSKAGKSTLLSTAPKPFLYLDVEGGSRFLNLRKKEWKPLEEPPPECTDASDWDTAVVTVRDYEEVKLAYRWLASGQHCFRGVGIDSLSVLQQRLIDKISNRQKMEYDGWGMVYRDFPGLVWDFHNLTQHPTKPLEIVAFVTASKETKEGKYRPFLQGQSQVDYPYIPDVIAVMEALVYTDPNTGEPVKVHRMTTGPHSRYETGERVGGRIPAYVDNPNLPAILDFVFGPEPSSVPASEVPIS